MKPSAKIILAAALVGTLGLGVLVRNVYATQANSQPSPSSENPLISELPVAPEKNPPGDIPDTQVFVTYRSPSGGYQLKVPEGWARRTNGKNVSFIDKLDGVEITVAVRELSPYNSSIITSPPSVN